MGCNIDIEELPAHIRDTADLETRIWRCSVKLEQTAV